MTVAFLIPGWLTNENYLTLATWGLVCATLVLGGATLLLFLDGRAKSKEQRRRWEREDEVRKSEAHPKVEFDLRAIQGRKLELWCANLGTSSFLLSSVQISSGSPVFQKNVSLGPLIVPVGSVVTVEILPMQLSERVFYGDNCEIRLEVRGPSEQLTTAAKPCRLHVYPPAFNGGRVQLYPPFIAQESGHQDEVRTQLEEKAKHVDSAKSIISNSSR